MFHIYKYISVIYLEHSYVCSVLQTCSCTQHALFTFQMPTRARSVNPFSWLGRPILKPQGPQSQDPRSFAIAAGYMNMFAEQNVHSYVQDKSQRYKYIRGT